MIDTPERITLRKFLEEMSTFREVMGSTKYTLEQKRDAFNNILILALRVETKTLEEENTVQTAIDMMAIEVPQRLFYEEMGMLGTQTGRSSCKAPNKSNGPKCVGNDE